MSTEGIKRRGFGSLSPERRKEIAARGGTAAHKKGTARVFTSKEARAAGAKGLVTRRAKAKRK